MERIRVRYNLVVPALLWTLGCYAPGGPVPEDPHSGPSREPIVQRVIVEQESIFSPAPGSLPDSAQEACNEIRFMRYRPETETGVPRDVNAILVLVPGYQGGANSFDYLGRQLVSMSEALGEGHLEVWAVDRRPNCLEDLTGLNAAEAAQDAYVAADYYYHGTAVDGRMFEGFLTDAELPFLSEFGLELLMNDLYTILTTKIPDPADRKNTVFLGGHSIGGPLSAFFAGWDFDGDPETTEDAGFANIAGMIGLDGFLRPWTAVHDEAAYVQSLENIRSGIEPRMNPLFGLPAELMALIEMFGMNAARAPDEDAVFVRQIPAGRLSALLVRGLHSRDLGHFLMGVPAVTDFRYTNEAWLGVLFDDNFQPVFSLQASLGFLHGGAVVEKTFPGDFAEPFGFGDHIDQDGLFIPWDPGPPLNPGSGPLYAWTNFDEVGDAGDPVYQDITGSVTYTTMIEEVTDIQDFARILFRGPTNFAEWYFASRLWLDMEVAAAPFSRNYGLSFIHKENGASLPKIEFSAGQGLLSGYNHQDVLFAAVDRPGHRENAVFGQMVDFVLAHSGGSVIPAN